MVSNFRRRAKKIKKDSPNDSSEKKDVKEKKISSEILEEILDLG